MHDVAVIRIKINKQTFPIMKLLLIQILIQKSVEKYHLIWTSHSNRLFPKFPKFYEIDVTKIRSNQYQV